MSRNEDKAGWFPVERRPENDFSDQSALTVLLPPSSAAAGLHSSFAIGPLFSQELPPNYFPPGHAPLLFRDKSPESDNASLCQGLCHSPNTDTHPPSHQSHSFPRLHQPKLLPRARRASLFPKSYHSNLAGFSQSLDIS